MKRTKLLALALAGVMVLALLTGCSDSSSKAKQVEECFRSLMKQRGDYQKDETLDKKLEVIAQKFQPDWLKDEKGELTREANNIIKNDGIAGSSPTASARIKITPNNSAVTLPSNERIVPSDKIAPIKDAANNSVIK